MLPLSDLRPGPLADARRRSRPGVLVALGLRLVLAAALLGVVVGMAESALWEPPAPNDQAPVADVCPDPPCPPESLPELRHLPLLVPPLSYLLAAVLGLVALALTVLSDRRSPGGRRGLLPALGPVAVLVAMEVVPHLVNPCLVAGMLGDALPSGCSRTAYGVDVHDRWHTLHHAVVGGLPAALGYTMLLRRRRPELFLRSGDVAPSVRAG